MLAEEVLAGNRRAVAKSITIVENNAPEKENLLKALYPHTGKAYVIGVTGSPGAGKSSLVDQLTKIIRQQNLTVGVIAVDPTSPFTGGALLGDRIRMQEHVLDEGVFIRSMGTRGSLGGLSRATKETIKVLDAAGKDIVIIETVGVGQSELDIMYAADTTVVVLTPGAGDIIQTLKAGIMEIADVFAVNKADLEGASKLAAEVGMMLDLDHGKRWRPPIVLTVSMTGQGVAELYAAVERHRQHMTASGQLQAAREQRTRSELMGTVSDRLKDRVIKYARESKTMENLVGQVVSRGVDPYQAAQQIIAAFLHAHAGSSLTKADPDGPRSGN